MDVTQVHAPIDPSPFAVGDEFKNLTALKSTLYEWAIKHLFEFKTT